jgi:hypothetical protein
LSISLLAEEHRASRIELDRGRDHDERRRQEQQCKRGPDQIGRPLDHPRGTGEAEAPHAEDVQAVEIVELDRGAHHLEHPRQHAHLEAKVLGGADQVEDHRLVRAGRGDHDAVDALRLRQERQRRARLARSGGRLEIELRDDPGMHGGAALDLLTGAVARGRLADQDAVLRRRQATSGEPCSAAGERQQRSEQQPEAEHLLAPQRTFDQEAVAEPQQKRHQRGDLEELRSLVERRLPEQQLVAVVEVEDLGEEQDQRRAGSHQGGQRIALAEQRDADGARECLREQVGGGEQAPVGAVAGTGNRRFQGIGLEPRRRIGQQPRRPAPATPAREPFTNGRERGRLGAPHQIRLARLAAWKGEVARPHPRHARLGLLPIVLLHRQGCASCEDRVLFMHAARGACSARPLPRRVVTSLAGCRYRRPLNVVRYGTWGRGSVVVG